MKSDKKRQFIIYIILLAVTLPTNGLSGQDLSQVRKAAEAFFAKHDSDGDAKLTKDEFPEQLRANFNRVDTNKDGFVVLSEDIAFRSRKRPHRDVPAGVTAHRDVTYATVGKKKLLLDLYVPDVAEPDRLPLIVWIHGGAWRAGNKQNCPALPFTTKGYVAASISYRLSHEAIFPAQIEDCKAAIRWLRANAERYKIDPNRIGVWGSSAGGHLVALLGASGDVIKLEGSGGNLGFSSRVQAVCDFFGPTDFLKMDQESLPNSPIIHDAPDSPESKLVGGAIQEYPDRVARANPITYVSPDDPPFLIVHGDKDPLVPWQQSKYLYEARKQAGLESSTRFEIIKGARHGFGRNQDVARMVERFFEQQLGAGRKVTDAIKASD